MFFVLISFGAIIVLILLIWFWIRFLNQVFFYLKGVRRRLLLWGALLVFLLFVYELIFTYFNIDVHYYIKEYAGLLSVSLFIFYGIFVLVCISGVFNNLKNKQIVLQILAAFISLILLASGGIFGWISVLVNYYFLSAFTEEMFKFTVGNNYSSRVNLKTNSTILLYAIIMGVSFSIGENIFAIAVNLFQGENITSSFLIGRGAIASLIHCISTGIIALVYMKLKIKTVVLRYIIALLSGFFIHFIYNMAVINNWTWGVIILFIVGLFGLSYLLYNLDELYAN